MSVVLRCGLLWLLFIAGCHSTNIHQPPRRADSFPIPVLKLSPGFRPNQTEAAVIRNAYAYLQALYRGDGKRAWGYSFVVLSAKQSWWNKQTALGALLLKAESSAYFAAQKQGVKIIDIPIDGLHIHNHQADITAYITYGNGNRDRYRLNMNHRNGQWRVAQE